MPIRREGPISWARNHIARAIWDRFRLFAWGRLNLRCNLRSGLHVEVRSLPDRVIYNEIFVCNEYTEAIQRSLDRVCRPGCFCVLDLGGNVGYSTVQVADCFLRQPEEKGELCVTVVEGSPPVFAELSRRLRDQPFLNRSVRPINGLVDEREGKAWIESSYTHYGHGASAMHRGRGSLVDYVALDEVMAGFERIDFLKCDIEGAECAMIQNFGQLLRRVVVAGFEFHHYGADLKTCATAT